MRRNLKVCVKHAVRAWWETGGDRMGVEEIRSFYDLLCNTEQRVGFVREAYKTATVQVVGGGFGLDTTWD